MACASEDETGNRDLFLLYKFTVEIYQISGAMIPLCALTVLLFNFRSITAAAKLLKKSHKLL